MLRSFTRSTFRDAGAIWESLDMSSLAGRGACGCCSTVGIGVLLKDLRCCGETVLPRA